MKDNNELESLLKNISKENVQKYAQKHLSEEKKEQLENILNDKRAIDSMMSSKEAQNLIKKLKGKKNG